MNSTSRTKRSILGSGGASAALVLILLGTSQVDAQQHWLLSTRLPAGEIGRIQVARRPELGGVFQPVLLKVPEGSNISVAEGSGFGVVKVNAELVSLQVGETYRMRVSNVPNKRGDVYPTVELIDRMHAPVGKETRYPIPIDITADDLGMALAGKYVTRVIYVEDPQRALPARDLPEQRYFEVMAHEDPLQVADSLGRPVAILRMGSVVPIESGPSAEFLFGSPPLQRHAMSPTQVPYVPSKLGPSDMPAKPRKADSSPAAPTELEVRVDDDALDLPEPPEGEGVDDTDEAGPERIDEPVDNNDENIFDVPDVDTPSEDDDNPFGDEI